MENNVSVGLQEKTKEMWQQAILSVECEYEKQPEVLFVGDVCIGTLGNFSASIGKAKSKKTFNLSAVVASALTDEPVLKYRARFPDGKKGILYVDTEQSTFHCQRVMKRIFRLAGLPEDKDCEQLQFLALRKNTPEERLSIIETAIANTEGLGLVIIDGVRDLVYDINSPAEATSVISKLMQWTDERQVHLHTILHQNKGDDNARGHIGTELNNKAETVMQIEKDKTDGNISVVEAVHIRSMEFDPFAFRINDRALPELVIGYKPTANKVGRPKTEDFDPYRDIPEATHRAAIKAALGTEGVKKYEPMVAALTKAYMAQGIKLSYGKVTKVVTCMTNKRLILLEDHTYTYNEECHY